MPTEGNINRVSSPGLDRELALLKSGPEVAAHRHHEPQSKGVIQSTQVVELPVPQVVEPLPIYKTEPQTTGSSREPQVGKIETAEDEPVSIAAVTKLLTEHFAGRVHKDSDLAEFRSQVIQAFKHLGLDTRKFFGV